MNTNQGTLKRSQGHAVGRQHVAPQKPYGFIGISIIVLKTDMNLYGFWAWWWKPLWVHMSGPMYYYAQPLRINNYLWFPIVGAAAPTNFWGQLDSWSSTSSLFPHWLARSYGFSTWLMMEASISAGISRSYIKTINSLLRTYSTSIKNLMQTLHLNEIVS